MGVLGATEPPTAPGGTISSTLVTETLRGRDWSG
jgi:hypothetical protein